MAGLLNLEVGQFASDRSPVTRSHVKCDHGQLSFVPLTAELQRIIVGNYLHWNAIILSQIFSTITQKKKLYLLFLKSVNVKVKACAWCILLKEKKSS